MEILKKSPSVNEYLRGIAILVFIIYLCQRYLKRNGRKLPPGPWGLPLLGYLPCMWAEPYKRFFKMRKKYGNLMGFRFGPNYVVILNDYEVTKETLSHPAALHREQELFGNMPIGFLKENGQQWVDRRRFCMHAMRNLGFGKSRWQNIIMDSAVDLIGQIASYKGQPVDIAKELHVITSNNIITLLIGRKLHVDSEKDKIKLCTQFADTFFIYVRVFRITSLISGLQRLFEWMGLFGYGQVLKAISSFVKLVKDEIEKHNTLQEYKYADDFINLYTEKIKTQEKFPFLSEETLVGDIALLFLGASDTIYVSIIWMICLMSENQDVQKKIQQEIDDVIGRDGTLNYDERTKVPYTMAALMEAQRFSSIVPISTTRTASEDFEIRGYTIPKKTLIMSNTWGLHNDPEYFENPDLFIPERFLLQGKNKINRNVPGFVPFSLGRRNCPGETMAYMVIFLLITKILQRFTISPPAGVKTKFKICGGLVQYLAPQKLRFTERA